MTLKLCSCGHAITTKNINRAVRTWEASILKSILWFDCPSCNSTGCLMTAIKDKSKTKLKRIIKGNYGLKQNFN